MTHDGSTEQRVLRVGVADDHPVFRDGLQTTLADEPGVDVIAAVADGEAAIAAAVDGAADVVLMDLRMPGVGGIEATARRRWPWCASSGPTWCCST